MEKKFKNKTILIVAGDNGAGLDCVKLFLKLGGDVIATCKNPSDFHEKVFKEDLSANESQLNCLTLDISKPKLIRAFLEELHATLPQIDILISNVNGFQEFNDFSTLTEELLSNDVKENAWPFFEVLIGIGEAFKSCPDYAISIIENSSRRNVDSVSKNMIRILTRYMSTNYLYENCKVNMLSVQKSNEKVFEDEKAQEFDFEVSDQEVAKTIITMCSGQLDGISGETLVLDRGMSCI